MIPDFLRTLSVPLHRLDGEASEVAAPVEEPLELQLRYPGDPPSTFVVVMRTPGDDLDLATGLLLAERIIDSADDLVELREAGIGRNTHNIVLATLGPDRMFEPRRGDRFEVTSAACGVCGTTAIDSTAGHLVDLAPDTPRIDRATVERALAELDGAPLAASTPGVHAAAVVDIATGTAVVREDGNDHFALDKAIGAAVREGMEPGGTLVASTGRASFEVVEKVLRFGAPAARFAGVPTSLAVRMSAEHGLTLLTGSGDDLGVYAGRARVDQTLSR